jgi:small-conductance mechanosensitive channel
MRHAPRLDIGVVALEIYGIKLIGLNADNGRKLIATVVALFVCWALSRLLHTIIRRLVPHDTPAAFWTRQFISIAALVVTVLLLASIWFDDPTKATTVLGLFTAGLAFALQRVVTSVAGYVLILRGGMFNVGDRIKMGGVRGDVIRIGFIQTTIMEMGQPPAEQSEAPGMWVEARQYSGRIVSVSNAQIFDEPVYNYTRDFPYLWEEMHLAIPFKADRTRAEQILRDAANRHAVKDKQVAAEAMRELQRRYFMKGAGIEPRVYLRITDNWIELAVRFVTDLEGVREVKDRMSREIMSNLDAAGIEIASSTYEITGVPPLRVKIDRDAGLSG